MKWGVLFLFILGFFFLAPGSETKGWIVIGGLFTFLAFFVDAIGALRDD